MRRLVTALALNFLTVSHLIALAAPVQAAGRERGDVRLDTPSGYPVPRFVSLKFDDTPCRAGPSFAYPVAFTYRKAGTPVRVVAETTDHWRKIADIDDAQCWVRQTALRAPSHVLVLEEAPLHGQPDPDAAVKGRLGGGVLARLERIEGEWARLSADGVKGWARTRFLWGVADDIAAHN